MKILMASHYFASHRGGVEVVAEQLFRALTEEDQEVVWMASNATPPPEPVGRSRPLPLPAFNLVEEKIGMPFPIPTAGALRTITREAGNAEILILHDCLYLSNILAFLAARWRGIPTMIVQHTRFFPNATHVMNVVIGLATTIVTRPMLSRAAQVVFIGETTRKSFARLRFKNPPELVFNGVDTNLYRRLEGSETKSALRREYGLPEDGTLILFVGRFVEKKGISIMQRMVKLRPDWTWVFAGWGPLDPASWNAPNVRVLCGLWGPSLAALYRCCDLLVLPTIGEGFPLVVQEALASGMPVVCGEETLGADPAMGAFVAGAQVFLGDEDRTAREFLSAIGETLASGAGSSDESEERRAFAVSRYSWHRAAGRYLEIVSRLVPRAAAEAAGAEGYIGEKRP
jgi:glycosyltransferase involved in cell wall biosynthesis